MADNVPITAGSGTPIAADDISSVWYQRVKLTDGTADSTEAIPGTAANGLDVDVTRIIPGNGATNLGKAEDAAHADGDTGVLMLGVRSYAGADTNGDYSALSVNASGNLNVAVATIVSGTGATNLGKAEDAAAADGDTGVAIYGIRNYAGAGADLDYSAINVGPTGEVRTFAHRDRVPIRGTVPGTSATAYVAGDQIGTMISFANAARASGGSGIVTSAIIVNANDTAGPMDLIIYRSNITLSGGDSGVYNISDTDAQSLCGIIQFGGFIDIGNQRIGLAHNLAIDYDCSGGTTLYGNLYARGGYTLATSDLYLTLFVERD